MKDYGRKKMRKKKSSKVVLVTIMAMTVLASLLVLPVLVFDTTENVVAGITSLSVMPGDTATVPVMVYGVTDLGAGTLRVTYNPSVCTVIDVTIGDYALVTKNISVPGLAIISAMDTRGHTGDVTFANLEIKAIGGCGESTPLDITVETLKTYGPPIGTIPAADISVRSGMFTILSPSPTPTPSGFEAILVIAGLY